VHFLHELRLATVFTAFFLHQHSLQRYHVAREVIDSLRNLTVSLLKSTFDQCRILCVLWRISKLIRCFKCNINILLSVRFTFSQTLSIWYITCTTCLGADHDTSKISKFKIQKAGLSPNLNFVKQCFIAFLLVKD